MIYSKPIFDAENSVTMSVVHLNIERKSSAGYLDQLIFEKQWEKARIFVCNNGASARKWRRCPQFMSVNGDSLALPIHLALTHEDVTIDFLESLIFAYPECVKKRESFSNRTCIHIAIKSRVPDHIIAYLINLYPPAAFCHDIYGRVPLHYAVSNMRSRSLISELVRLCPASIFAQDNRGWSCLHVAVDTFCSIEVINLFLSISLELITLKTKLGKTPLDIAKESSHTNNSHMIYLLSLAQKKFEQLPVVQNIRRAEKSNKNMHLVMDSACFA